MKQTTVAIIAANNLLLESLLEYWEESSLNHVELLLVALAGDDGETILYKGRPLLFQSIDTVDFSNIQLLVVLESRLAVDAYADLIRSLGCPVLGFMNNLATLEPKILDIKNVGNIERSGIFGLVQTPVAVLQQVLHELKCESIDLTVLYPVSVYGRQGINELASQTVRLLNSQSVEHKIFDKQMPFNYFPMVEGAIGLDFSAQLTRELNMTFDEINAHVSAMQMPVFHGLGMLVAVVLSNEVELDKMQLLWAENENIYLEHAVKDLSNMDCVQQENRILLGNVRKSDVDNYRFDCWIGVDDIKFSASKQLIFAADFLLKHHL